MTKTFLITFFIAVILFACNSQKSSNQPSNSEPMATQPDTSSLLTGKKWILKELGGIPIIDTGNSADKKAIFLEFKDSAQTINGFGGCNGYGGNYELKEGNRIQFSQVVSTMMACENTDTETKLFKVFETADNYFCDGKKLQLNKARMAPLAVFEAVASE
jgi:heat shock protein HslJ